MDTTILLANSLGLPTADSPESAGFFILLALIFALGIISQFFRRALRLAKSAVGFILLALAATTVMAIFA